MSGRRAKIVAGIPVVSLDALHVRMQQAAYGMCRRGWSVRDVDAVWARWRAWVWGWPASVGM